MNRFAGGPLSGAEVGNGRVGSHDSVGLFARQLTSAASTTIRRGTCTHYAANEAAISPLDLAQATQQQQQQPANSWRARSPFQGLRGPGANLSRCRFASTSHLRFMSSQLGRSEVECRVKNLSRRLARVARLITLYVYIHFPSSPRGRGAAGIVILLIRAAGSGGDGGSLIRMKG